jgi:hypothetical protein
LIYKPFFFSSVYAAIKYASEAMQKTSTEKPKGGGSIIATASGIHTPIYN